MINSEPLDDAPAEGWCNECHDKCVGTWIDEGIGPYEYWGATGVDENMQWRSYCCHDTVLSSLEDELTLIKEEI